MASETNLTVGSTAGNDHVTRPEIAFISGPINSGPNGVYFHTYYVPRIQQAIEKGHKFVIGPIPSGIDANALDYLLAYPVAPEHITIFVTPAEEATFGPRFRAMSVNLQVVESQMTQERDAAMTQASTYDILRVRTMEEAREFYGGMARPGYVTNTERNWRRRRGMTEDLLITAEEINCSMGYPASEVLPLPEGSGKNGVLDQLKQALKRRR
ncbi:uncharacterized protein N7473_004199 [Penicillium subrubescens]|jgi:hypothetical protein|uniref:Uncharacterized protein n=1 Tax=Penicillium subrubescens TaxID=1316194 RepID=A0A1Q5UIE0_9EURO|nr:uncharacterized protein N7473_004199 [Penicillium subrubescens]KAJ5907283.1 hypothetical protein N7473_004199 [Penicillium subrubescens]OKP12232.1 hypothetical protein PENSUB_1968 [Penicillium subrubescens]